MSGNSTDTRFGHLDLSDLIADAAGQALTERAGRHLAGCEQCQREASRWNLVASGVRGLAAAALETAEPSQPPRTRRHMRTISWQRAVLTVGSAAAALVLLVGVGVLSGYVHVHLSGPGTETALTAVTGCSQLEQADGTLERVNSSSLIIKTGSGQPLTVTTTPATFLSMSGALLREITDGASVMVRGSMSNGTIDAAIITVGQPFSAVSPPGFAPVSGTVAAASTSGFTLVTPSRTRIPVTTSNGTLVVVPHASPGQLRPGATIFAVGHAGADGTLAAVAVASITRLQSGANLHIGISVKDCSPSSVDEALGAISAANASAG